MDLEHLTKHQIVLLTLLVSFVTSIATGIVTVSLVNQAPPEVQRTINQIVERTVETVQAPLPTQAEPAAAVAAVQNTVVVKDDDLAAQSIASAQKAIVRIVAKNNPSALLARGVMVSPTVAITDRAALRGVNPQAFEAILYSGERVPVVVRGGDTAIATLDVAVGSSTGYAPAPIADMSKVKLGASVIRIGGTGSDTVATGVVAALAHDGVIQASVLSATPGSVLITLFGEVIGITTGGSQGQNDHYTIPPPTP